MRIPWFPWNTFWEPLTCSVLVLERTPLMEDRPVVRASTTHNTGVRYTSVPRAGCKPPISVLERGKAYCIRSHHIVFFNCIGRYFLLSLYFDFPHMTKMMTDVCSSAASVAYLCIQGSQRNDHVILVTFITLIISGA